MNELDPGIFDHPVSRVALEIFRLNGELIAAGDILVAPLGLTSARWQVMGAVAEARGGLPVAALARNMGLVRQSVQRIVNELVAEGLLRLDPNPHHRRAKLVRLTEEGQSRFDGASARWRPVADAVLAALGPRDTEEALRLLAAIRAALASVDVTADDETLGTGVSAPPTTDEGANDGNFRSA